MITQEFNLNLIPDQAPVVVHVDQYDTGEGRLIAHLYNEDVPYTPTDGATVRIQGTKPDRFGFEYGAALSGNTVTADLTEQMSAVAGRTVVNIIVHESGNRTGTFNFFLDVQKSALGNDTLISRSDGSILDVPDLVKDAEKFAERAEKAAGESEESSYDSEAWAKGTRNGTEVSSTDETYRNNSRHFSEVSKGRSEDAEAWAVGERGGVAVPSTDTTYENNSKYYAEQAEGSADHAADIVNDANYLIGVDPTAINNPTTPYLRPSDVVDSLASTATDKPLSANQGKILLSKCVTRTFCYRIPVYGTPTATATGKTIYAQDIGYVYLKYDDIPILSNLDKEILSVNRLDGVESSTGLASPSLGVINFFQYKAASGYFLWLSLFNFSASSTTFDLLSFNIVTTDRA